MKTTAFTPQPSHRSLHTAAFTPQAAEPKRDPDPARVRLAALSACAVSSTRAEAGAGLPKLLYAKSR